MRPYKHLRKGSGYCCERCDGPYNAWKKKTKRCKKRKDKAIDKREVQKEYERWNDDY